MSIRYVPRSSFVLVDKKGRQRQFNPNRRRSDGTLGYTKDEVDGLYKEQLRSFKTVGVDVEDEVVEQATAAPGEKRSLSRRSKVKDES